MKYTRTGRVSKANRKDAIAEWELQVARANKMGEGNRVQDRPLSAFSANEVVNMTWSLKRTLDRIESAVTSIGEKHE